MTTFCEDCDNVHPESRKRHPAQWLCTKFPRMEGQGFVARKVWTDAEPFLRCNSVNGGLCPMFAPKREVPDADR